MIDKLAWIHLQDDKILSTISKGKNTFYIPGGKREQGESDIDALCREIKEELSVDLIPASIQYYGTFQAQAHSHPQGIIVQMTCYTADYTGILTAAAEIERFDWLSYTDRFASSAVDQLIFQDLKEKGLLGSF